MNQIKPDSTTTNAMPVMIRIAMKRPSIGPANVEPLGGSHQCMERSSFSSLGREAEVPRLRLAARHGHGGGLRAVLLVPRLDRSEEHTSELQSRLHLVCRLLLEKKKKNTNHTPSSTHVVESDTTRVERLPV